MHLTSTNTSSLRPVPQFVRSMCGLFCCLLLTLIFQTSLAGNYEVVGQVVIRVPDKDWDVYSLVEAHNRLWVAQSGSVYFIDKGEVKALPGNVPYVNTLSSLKDEIWLATRRGAYRLDGDVATPVLPDGVVRRVELVGQEIWFATDKGAYPLSTRQRTPDVELDVRRIEQINGQVWLATKTGAYRIDGSRLINPWLNLKLSVHVIKSINGQMWLGTETGLYIYDGTNITLASEKDLYINDISYIDNRIWLATFKGPYIVETNTVKPILTQQLDVKEIRKIGQKIWLGAGHHPGQETPGGVYRFDEDVSISVRPARSNIEALLQSIFANTWFEGVSKADVQYVSRTNNKDPYNEDVAKQFEVVITFGEAEFGRAVRTDQYSPVSSFERYLPSGAPTIYMSARDKWRNKFDSEPITAWVIPNTWFVPPLLVAVMWWLLLVIVILLAPYSSFCLRALMNPALRNYASFGFVPLVLTLFPAARRHLLKRYLREITTDREFTEWQTRFVLPSEEFSAAQVVTLFSENRVLFLEGESGIGKTCYFKYLVGCFASNRKLLPRVFPVFLPLKRYEGMTPKEIFTKQLEKQAKLTDVQLTEWFLSNGDFLIFIDGLNEVDDKTVKAIASFVDGLEKVNYFYLSSQGLSPLEKVHNTALPKLEAEQIRQILRNRLDPVRADATIKHFENDAELFKTYGLPQELELAIDLMKKGLALPRNTPGLYEATLEPIFESWRNAGVDYETDLGRHAYEMLSTGKTSFEEKNSLSTDILKRLEKNKVLYFRGGRYHFRHDLIRGYLAAKFLAPRWRTLFDDKEKLQMDVNWNSTIKFLTLVYDQTSDTKQLLFAVLKQNSQVAKDVFNWLEKEHPRLVEDWSDEFDLKYGKAMRTVVSVVSPRTMVS